MGNLGKSLIIVIIGFMLAASPAIAGRHGSTAGIAITGVSGLAMSFVCMATSIAARGETPRSEFDRRGWMVGLNAGYGLPSPDFNDKEEDSLNKVLPGFDVSLDGNNGSGVVTTRGGYRCGRWFSVELGVEWLSPIDRDIVTSSQGKISSVEIDPIYISSNVKGYLLSGRYQPFVTLGAGALNIKSVTTSVLGPPTKIVNNFTAVALRMGGGIDIYVTKNFVFDLELSYVLPVSTITNYQYLSIGAGLLYRF